MAIDALTRVDHEELFRLALLDCQAARHEEAIDKLKRLIEMQPEHAAAHFLLGAEHAELGLFDRAIAETERATELDPSLATAHFQLGLIHYFSSDLDAARKRWALLGDDPGTEVLSAFKNALLLLSDGDPKAALEELTLGLKLPTDNPALHRDMANIKLRVEAGAGNTTEPQSKPSVSSSAHALLTSYENLVDKPPDPDKLN